LSNPLSQFLDLTHSALLSSLLSFLLTPTSTTVTVTSSETLTHIGDAHLSTSISHYLSSLSTSMLRDGVSDGWKIVLFQVAAFSWDKIANFQLKFGYKNRCRRILLMNEGGDGDETTPNSTY
ncbi:hypothetical protein Prudu_274S000400, partial [Prunus dulcis]